MNNLYIPQMAVINNVVDETYDTKTFTVHFTDDNYNKKFSFKSGQFLEVSVFGIGECPIGFASSPFRTGTFDITVRDAGSVTHALHQKGVGDMIGLRGPLGNNFPFEEVKGQDILFVGGGIGLPPLKSLIDPMLENRNNFNRLIILYGARTPADRVYKTTLTEWTRQKDIEFLETVDVGDEEWKKQGRHEGVVTSLFKEVAITPKTTFAFTCGPPIMIKFVIQDLLSMGFAEDRIISTLERYMKCGVGKCGHCAIGHKYVCTDGPVFTYQQIRWLPEQQ